jgi:hypothetical protein
MIVRYIDSPPVVTAIGGGTTGIETETGEAIDGVAIVVVDAVAPEFETEEEVCEVAEYDVVREIEGVSPLETVASDEDDAETWTLSEKDETLGLSVTVDVCAGVVDAEDTLVETEASEAEVEGSWVSLRISIVSDVEARPSVVPTIETDNLLVEPVILDVVMSASGAESVDNKLVVIEVAVIEGMLSDATVVSFVDVAEMPFPSINVSDKGECSAIESAATLARL